MSDPFLGEVKVVSFNFAPRGWALCNGQLMSINQNQALYSVLGVQYGGDGVTTFALPNLQGRVPIHWGNRFVVGQAGGEAAHTLTINEMPTHTHPPVAQSAASNPGSDPTNSVWAPGSANMFAAAPAGPTVTMSPAAIGNTGANQPHENQSPYLVLNFVIALQGVYPSRS